MLFVMLEYFTQAQFSTIKSEICNPRGQFLLIYGSVVIVWHFQFLLSLAGRHRHTCMREAHMHARMHACMNTGRQEGRKAGKQAKQIVSHSVENCGR